MNILIVKNEVLGVPLVHYDPNFMKLQIWELKILHLKSNVLPFLIL